MNISTIDYVVFEKILKRGTAEVLEDKENALFIYDTLSEGYFLACEDFDLGMSILDKYIDDIHLLMVTNTKIGDEAYKKYGFDGKSDCYQFAYYEKDIDEGDLISFREASKADIPVLLDNYDKISAEEMEKEVSLGNISLGYDGKNLVGFMGEHLEGSMGLLYVFPEFRRRGYASAFEKHFIKSTIEKGFIPYGHVIKDNEASIKLQKSLGLEQSENLISWMWR